MKSQKRLNLTGRVLERRKRRIDVEKMLLQGITDARVLANRHGVSLVTMSKDIKYCFERFALRDGEARYRRKAVRMAELDNIINVAMTSFYRSQENEETIATKEEDGKEIVTRTVKGQAGDPAFLRIAKDAQVEKAKLDGLYVQKHEVASAANSPIDPVKVKEKDSALSEIFQKIHRNNLNSIAESN